MNLVIDPQILSKAFRTDGNAQHIRLRKEIIETLEAIADSKVLHRESEQDPVIEIFISYKSEDRWFVEDIHRFLTARKYKVWFDLKRLTGGDEWYPGIHDAMRRAGIFLTCISTRSVNVEGVHNEECKEALIRQKRQPLGRGFIIPVRLENVPFPANLDFIQAVDLFADDGWDKLIDSIVKEIEARSGNSQSNAEESLAVYEDEQIGESRVYKRYKEVLADSPEFQDWYHKLRHYYGGFTPIHAGRLMPDHENVIKSFECRSVADDVFIKVAKAARAYFVSEGGVSEKCHQGHLPPPCVLDYLRDVMHIPILSVGDALVCLQRLRQRVSGK